jgi:hypothetical protein
VAVGWKNRIRILLVGRLSLQINYTRIWETRPLVSRAWRSNDPRPRARHLAGKIYTWVVWIMWSSSLQGGYCCDLPFTTGSFLIKDTNRRQEYFWDTCNSLKVDDGA